MAGLPTVVVYVPGPTAARPAHRKVTIANRRTAVTFDLISPASELSDLAAQWAVQSRPGIRKPITRRGPQRLARETIHATLAKPNPQASVETDLLRLKGIAHAGEPVAIGYGIHSGSAVMTSSGFWVVDDFKADVIARAQGSNNATRVDVTLELLEANIPGWRRPASLAKPAKSSTFELLFPVARPAPEVPPAAAYADRPRSVVVAAGDSLVGLGVRFYGDADLWRAIADANGILDPRAIRAGQVLVLP